MLVFISSCRSKQGLFSPYSAQHLLCSLLCYCYFIAYSLREATEQGYKVHGLDHQAPWL